MNRAIAATLILISTTPISGFADTVAAGGSDCANPSSNFDQITNLLTGCNLKTYNPKTGAWEQGCHVGAPINPANGEVYIIGLPDFTIQSEGSLLSVFRTYRSQLSSESILGKSWRYNFESTFRPLGSGQLEFIDETGKALLFANKLNDKGLIEIPMLPGATVTGEPKKGYLLETADGVTRAFNTHGHLIEIKYPSGQKIIFAYAGEVLSEIRDSWGRSIRLSYLGPKLAKLSSDLHDLVAFRYDPDGRLVSARYADGTLEKYEYLDRKSAFSGLLLSRVLDAANHVLEEHRYDSANQGTYSASADGAFSIAYALLNENSRTVRITNETTHEVSRFVYDSGGRLLARDRAIGIASAENNTYNERGQLVSQKNGGVLSEITYDANGNPNRYSQKAGNDEHHSEIRYVHPHHLPTFISQTSVLNPKEPKTTTFEYKGDRLLAERERGFTMDSKDRIVPYERVTRYQYNEDGQLLEVRSPDESKTEYSYYPKGSPGLDSGRVRTVKTADGQEISFSHYDLFGTALEAVYNQTIHVRRKTNEMGKLIEDSAGRKLSYDAGGALTDIHYPSGETKRYQYGKYAELQSVSLNAKYLSAPLKAVAPQPEAKADDADSILKGIPHQLDARGGFARLGNVSFQYDIDDHVVSARWPNGSYYDSTYDDRGLLVREKTPEFGVIHYQYDLADRVISRTDGSGQAIKTEYDSEGRPLREGKTEFGYLPSFSEPNLIRTSDAEIRFEFDSLGRRIFQYINPKTNESSELSIGYIREPNGGVHSLVYPDGYVVTYGIDPASRQVTTITDSLGKTLFSASRFQNRRPVEMKVGPLELNTRYSSEGRLLSLKAGPMIDRTFDYSSGRLARSTDHVSGVTQKFDHNPNGFLTGDGRWSMEYDEIGNLLTLKDGPVKWNLNYDSQTHRLKQLTDGRTSYSAEYDVTGRIISDGAHRFAYDELSRLVEVKGSNLDARYAYDPLGRRISKTVNGVQTFFAYDEEDRLLFENTPARNEKTRYIYRGYELLSVEIQGPPGKSKNYYVVNDHHLTPIAVFNESGEIVASAEYDNPFSVQMKSKQPGLGFHFGFPGQYRDVETGLVYNVARYLDPRVGRYLTPDPKLILGGANLYAYAASDPSSLIDVLGTTPSDAQIHTAEDAKLCHTPSPTNLAQVDPLSIPDSGAVYHAGSNRWSLDQEKSFASWVKNNVKVDFMQKYNIPTDCAKAAMVVRSVYSRIAHLPFIVTNGRTTASFASTAWAGQRTVRDWSGENWKDALNPKNPKNDQRFHYFLMAAMNTVFTGTVNLNLYPTRLTDEHDPSRISQYVHEGTILLTPTETVGGMGHTRWISSMESPDDPYFPVRKMNSMIPFAVRNLDEGQVDLGYPQEMGYGVLNWRWPVNCPGRGWTLADAKDMPGFSTEQYQWSEYSSVEEAQKDVDWYKEYIQSQRKWGLLTPKAEKNFQFRMGRAQREVDDLKAGRIKPTPVLAFSNYLNGLARDPKYKVPTEQDIAKQVSDFKALIEQRVSVVNDALKKLQQDPKAFDNHSSPAYDDASTPERDAQDLRSITPILRALNSLGEHGAANGGALMVSFAKQMLAAKVQISPDKSISLLAYYTLLSQGAVSSEPADSFEKRWGIAKAQELYAKLNNGEAFGHSYDFCQEQLASLKEIINPNSAQSPAGPEHQQGLGPNEL